MSVEVCIREGAERLAAASVEEPRREARLLHAHAMGVTSDKLIANVEQAVRNASGYFELVDQRASRVPLSRIIGRREFWSLEFCLTDHTFDPRADSESVVEAALDFIADRDAALRVADFGTGTGCLLLSLLSELRNASGVGIDRKPATVKAAVHNAANLGLTSRATFLPVTGELQFPASSI